MAKVVLGIGTSQSSILGIPPEHWADRGKKDMGSQRIFRADGTKVSYAELAAEVGDKYADRIVEPRVSAFFTGSRKAVKRLADDIARAQPDLLVVIADDQAELFDRVSMPAVSIYRGAHLTTARKDLPEGAPDWMQAWYGIHKIDRSRNYPAAPELADELIEKLIAREFDVAAVGEPVNPDKGIGHAWAFVPNMLCNGRTIPILPVVLNTWYAPNVPTLARCYKLGQALRAALDESPRDLRVGIIASGGMSHHLINEDLDRQVLKAMQTGDEATLVNLPLEALYGGTCQVRDWIVLAGALGGLKSQWAEYWPGYRTPAGTGVGLGFASWS
ncbi:MAG TPA: hypothetical protein VMU59_15060 [Caulobacteraceae bacterium]|nr:hypothetical protein [Caulobacteraceae bacterium]